MDWAIIPPRPETPMKPICSHKLYYLLTGPTCAIDHEWLYDDAIANLHVIDVVGDFRADTKKLVPKHHR